MVVFAPIETSSPIQTLPKWAMLCHFFCSSSALPKPSDPITAPGKIIHLLPSWHSLWIVTLAPIYEFSPMLTLSSITQFGAMIVFLPILTFFPITQPGPIMTSSTEALESINALNVEFFIGKL